MKGIKERRRGMKDDGTLEMIPCLISSQLLYTALILVQ
jgi:hypothetical protein